MVAVRGALSQAQLRSATERRETDEGGDVGASAQAGEAHAWKRLAKQAWSSPRAGMALTAAGLLAFFLAYGVLQERIMTRPYGEEMFSSSAFAVLCNRVVAVCGAGLFLLREGSTLHNSAPLWKSSCVGLSNTLATLCQWEALKYVSFPAQTLGKCGKTIPVLVFGSLLAAKRYTAGDYLVCIAISLGCAVFLLTGDVGVHEGQEDTWHGLGLLGLYLALDGFTSVFQELLFKGYNMSTYNQMLHVNLSSGFVIILVLLLNDELMPSIAFCRRHPDFFLGSFALSCAAMLGQVMLYHSIKHYGALFFATVMTTRHIFSITLSCVIYLHPMSWGQFCGAALVFGTLYARAATKQKPSPSLPGSQKVLKI